MKSKLHIRLAVATCAISLLASASAADSGRQTKDRARLVLSHVLPNLAGDRLKGMLVEVGYGPGEMSPPHSHPCAVMGYVVEGTIRTQVEGEPETTFKAGESFYEAPNGVHLISGNASATEPAKFVAYFVCDHDAPLSSNVPAHTNTKERSR